MAISAVPDPFGRFEPQWESCAAAGGRIDLGMLEPPSAEMQQLFASLRGNQADTDRFMGILAGTTSIPEFFAAENVGRIMAAARTPTTA